MEYLKQLLRRHLLAVPLVLADDRHLPPVDLHGELVPLVLSRHQIRVDARVSLLTHTKTHFGNLAFFVVV